MDETPQTYSGRCRLIAEILDPVFDVRAMVPTNTSAFERDLFPDSLMCSWADAETRSPSPGRRLALCLSTSMPSPTAASRLPTFAR